MTTFTQRRFFITPRYSLRAAPLRLLPYDLEDSRKVYFDKLAEVAESAEKFARELLEDYLKSSVSILSYQRIYT